MKKTLKKVLACGLSISMIWSAMPLLPTLAENIADSRGTPSVAARKSVSSLGDIWDSWSGKTSFEFLDGNHGDGMEKTPFMIKNKEQLMGLSELTAMGMTILDESGIDYVGNYSGCSFALSGNIDLQGVEWIPIGFYRDSSENGGVVTNPFRGQFDGNGYAVKNFKLNTFESYNHVGLFGAIENSTIEDVILIPDSGKEITGNDGVGVLIGSALDSVIRDVTVKNGYVSSTGISGGIVGDISDTIIENAVCSNVKINATDGGDIIYVGGITGAAANSVIADCEVSTGNNLTSRIQGTGYVGGIVGYQNSTDIYNTHVSGTIGGYHSTAIGGITGQYGSGKIKTARFDGTIGNSQLGSMAREGTFIGTRQGAGTNFNYIDDIAYLFADSESKISASVCGSEISDDNDYTYDAHIGYWHAGDNFYTLIQGGSSKNIMNQYFYEELEKGILEIMDTEGNERFLIDHFAPNSLGKPVPGNLIIVNQVDIVAGGQNFYDIAELTVRGSSQYSKDIDKNHRGAAAKGDIIYVDTSPNNTITEKFEMDGQPYYVNAENMKKNSTYSDSSHCYTFKMPSEDITVSAIYKKVAVSIMVNPDTYGFAITQTRTGNRKNPAKTTEVKNKDGKLIAKYINGLLESGTQVQPVKIEATIDTNNDVSDNRVRWSIDDAALISLAKNDDEESEGYTEKSASIAVNLDAAFFTDIITNLEKKQTDENYQFKIPNTIYGAGHQNGGVAILTAETRPSTSFEGKPCTANSRINVTFQVIDNTLVATEGAELDKQVLAYTVTRTLTGNRRAPVETVTVTAPQSLAGTFTPDFFSRAEVIWSSSDSSIVEVIPDQEAYKEASVVARKDAKWIRDIIATDQGMIENDRYTKVSGNGTRTAVVTIDGKDKLGNHAFAKCQVVVDFVTDDRTKVTPEGITIDKSELQYDLTYEKVGNIRSETIVKTGFETKQLIAVVIPDIEKIPIHQPYDRAICWSSSDPGVVSVDANGNVTPVADALWIKKAMERHPYTGTTSAVITPITSDGIMRDPIHVTLKFKVIDHTTSSGGESSSTPGGGSSVKGGFSAPIGAVIGTWTQTANRKWLFASGRTYADEWAYINNPYATGKQPKASWFRFDKDGFLVIGWYTDQMGDSYYLNPIADGTQGQMLVGWQYIEGVWYYFNSQSDGSKGKILKDTFIDGIYRVNGKGQYFGEKADG